MGTYNKTLYAGVVVIVAILAFQFFSYRLLGICALNKAPFIYGFDACETIFTQGGDSWSILGPVSAVETLFSSKIYFRGSINSTNVLFKSLSSSQSFQAFDSYTDYYLGDNPKGINFDSIVYEIAQHLSADEPKNLFICPRNEGIETFITSLKGRKSPTMSDSLWFASLWTLLKLNPEPAILMLLEPPKWPVPKYYGSCGRLAVVEDCGTDLSNYRESPLSVRVKISLQIIQMMLQFTKNHPHFSFYLTDVSLDNFAFGMDGTVRFVDFENLIIVHRNTSVFEDMSAGHVTDHQDCHNCFAFSPQDVCSRPYSDHNIYAVCKEIFSPMNLWKAGFLHDHPNKELNNLIDLCVKGNGTSRFQTIKKINDILTVST